MPQRKKVTVDDQVKRTCPVCSTVYLADPGRLKHGRQTTCGRACSYLFRAQQMQTSVALVCAVCEREFTRQPAHVKGKHGAQFCSRECHYLGRGTGDSLRVVRKPYRYTDDGWARLSKAGADAYAAGSTLTHTQSERLVAGALAGAGEQFVHQYVVVGERRTFVADFYLPGRNLVIELDGPEHRHKGRSRDRDAELDAELLARGVNIAHIPLSSAEDVRRAVLDTLRA